MKKITLLFMALFLVSQLWAQTTFWTLDFETAGGYTTTPAEFTDGGTDFFTRTDGSNIGGYTLSNLQGSWFFAAQDIDGDQAVEPVVLTVDDVNISGISNLQFGIYLAEEDDGSNQDWDDLDYVHIDYDIDNSGSWTNLIWIENDGTTFNAAPLLDTNFDGDGDGTEITSTFTEFTANIAGTGSTIDIRVTFQVDSGDEDLAIDNLSLTGNAGAATTTVAFSGSSASVSEGAGSYDLTLSIANEDGATATQCEVALTTGSATDINNYTTQTVTFPAGSGADQTVTITITDDAVYEGDETLTFEIQNVSGGNSAATTSPSSFNLTLEENDWPTATIPYAENFSDCGASLWQDISVASNRDWSCGSGYMEINGYGGDVGSDDYLISPAFNLNNYSDEVLAFESYNRFSDATYPPIELLYSTNFAGNVAAATWHPLTATWSAENSQTITHSGNIDVSGINGTAVYFAFHYTSSGTGAGTSSQWRIDNVSIIEDASTPPGPITELPNAWINEIHYDNDGIDVNEMIEIVVERADTLTLSDFTITLYNGGDGAPYNTRTLDFFTVGDTEGDYTFYYLIYPPNGIQNGPDAISLDWKGTVVQFLSYEGSFVGVGGPADGITSTDIGVAESGSKPVGQSLQLIGTGLEYSHFTWVDPVANPGSMNGNQLLAPPPPPVPVDWHYVLLTFFLIAGVIVYRKIR